MKNDGTMVNAYVRGAGHLSPEDEALVARRMRVLGPAYRLFYETPVHLLRGEGVWLYDRDGQAYLDTYNNVASVGHCHPHVLAATTRQSFCRMWILMRLSPNCSGAPSSTLLKSV